MPIKIKCQNAACAKVLVVKDEMLGKAIKCPSCQAVVTVPNPASRPAAPAAPAPAPAAPAANRLQVKCSNPACAKVLVINDEMLGKAIKCPKCQAVMTIPKPASKPAAPAAPAPAPAPAAPAPVAPSANRLQVKCNNPACAKVLIVKDDMLGKAIKCPSCQAVMTIPRPASKPAAPAAPAPAPAPAAPAANRLQVKCSNPACGKVLVVKDDMLGKAVKCPSCKSVTTVPKPRGKPAMANRPAPAPPKPASD